MAATALYENKIRSGLLGKDSVLKCLEPLVATTGCCCYCALRFLGIKNISLFQESPQVVLSVVRALSHKPDLMQPANLICPACAGLFSLIHEEETKQFLISKVKNCGYAFESYRLTLHFPVFFSIRQHSLYIFLQSAIPGSFTVEARNAIIEVKDAWHVGPMLDNALNIRFDIHSLFLIEIHSHQPQEEAISDEFLKHYELSTTTKIHGVSKTTTSVPNAQTCTKLFLSGMADNIFLNHYQAPPPAIRSRITLNVKFSHQSVFIVGRYNKYSQDISQTPWLRMGGKPKTLTSIQDLIVNPILNDFGCSEVKFNASGREDVDVRMLGNGRPFAIELIDPHNALHSEEDYAAMQSKINSSTKLIQISHLQYAKQTDCLKLKEAETHKRKSYRALVWSSRALNKEDFSKLEGTKDVHLDQKTPIRVLHRRCLAVRDKIVHEMRVEPLSPHFFILFMKTSAGTYIKEFVHGDLGRTQPNIGGLLGCDSDILQLDVVEVETNYPPPIRPTPELPHSFSLPESFIIADREKREESNPTQIIAASPATNPEKTTTTAPTIAIPISEEEPQQKRLKTNEDQTDQK